MVAALPKQNGGKNHHRALPHHQVGDALVKVREAGVYSTDRLVVELPVLTTARSAEVRGAVWSEIDLKAATCVIPAERMKVAREHRVRLSGRKIQVLAEARRHRKRTMAPLARSTRRIGTPSTPHRFVAGSLDMVGRTHGTSLTNAREGRIWLRLPAPPRLLPLPP